MTEYDIEFASMSFAAISSGQHERGANVPKTLSQRAKLGLALAGGGFRASLFHLGVLRRMAELDLLRYVQVLSTVSGGSIVGAHYILLLKRRLEDPQYQWLGPDKLRLPQTEYVAIIDQLQRDLVHGIKQNLRTSLLKHPLIVLRVMFSKASLASEMGRLYEQCIFAKANPDSARRIPLTDIRLRKQQVKDVGGTEQYNNIAVDPENDEQRGGAGSAVTRLILNATSLNSGARFWFSHTEMGDWYLGHIRRDEIESELLPRKILRELASKKRQELLDFWANHAARKNCWIAIAREFIDHWGPKWPRECTDALMFWAEDAQQKVRVEFVHWLIRLEGEQAVKAAPLPCFRRGTRSKREERMPEPEMPLPWNGPLHKNEFQGFVHSLLGSEAGRLRDAKNHAWYLAHGRFRTPRVCAGLDDQTLWALFWDALKSIDEACPPRLESAFRSQQPRSARHEPAWCKQLLDGVLEVYYCRTAAAMSPKARDEWDALPLADAVAASAAFPPVFPPFQLHDIYDDLHVQVLSLTDGGPFDNIGVTALLDEHCNYVIASDTGAVFDKIKSPVGRVRMMSRLLEMLMNRPAELYRLDINERRRLGRAVEADLHASPDPVGAHISQFATARELKGLASFHIRSSAVTTGAPAIADSALVAGLRTDLDVFGDVEIKCLVNAGYFIADQYLKAGFKDSPFGPLRQGREAVSRWEQFSLPFPMDLHDQVTRSRVERILKVGQHRFFRSLMLGAPVSVVVTVCAAITLLAAVSMNKWQWANVSDGIKWLVTKVLTWDFIVVALQSIPLLYALVIVLCVPLVWLILTQCLAGWVLRGVQYMRREYARTWRSVLTFWKNARGFKGNLLWLFKLLPIAALVVIPIAWVSHLFFAVPFRWKTTDPEGLDGKKKRLIARVAAAMGRHKSLNT